MFRCTFLKWVSKQTISDVGSYGLQT
uniref:Uncharacterized protein n=1 Tax=Anguilla anguilla TaxID=7936 RepID=A0A0E9WE32_ANGAN